MTSEEKLTFTLDADEITEALTIFVNQNSPKVKDKKYSYEFSGWKKVKGVMTSVTAEVC